MTDFLEKTASTTQLLIKEKPIFASKEGDRFESILFLPEGRNRKGEVGLRTKGYFKKSYDGKPLVGIITVVYNGEKYLEETIQSVLKQAYDNVEYIYQEMSYPHVSAFISSEVYKKQICLAHCIKLQEKETMICP